MIGSRQNNPVKKAAAKPNLKFSRPLRLLMYRGLAMAVASAPPPSSFSTQLNNLPALPRTNYLMRNERLGASINSGDSTYRIQAFYDDCEGTGRRYASLEHKVLVSVKTPLGRSRTDAGQFPKSENKYYSEIRDQDGQKLHGRVGKKKFFPPICSLYGFKFFHNLIYLTCLQPFVVLSRVVNAYP